MFKYTRLFNSIKFESKLLFCSVKKPIRYDKTLLVTSIITGSVIITGFLYKKYKIYKIDERIAQNKLNEGVGVPLIGGDFHLTDHNGKGVSLLNYRGKWLLIYFGFCNCPDICPEQLEKLALVAERLEKSKSPVIPLFISIDPDRDTPEIMKEYLKEFSDTILGLTGNKEEIYSVSKTYRIYYSKGPVDKFGDYIVDHAVVMYLIGPEGEFVEFYGQNKSVPEIARNIQSQMRLKRAA